MQSLQKRMSIIWKFTSSIRTNILRRIWSQNIGESLEILRTLYVSICVQSQHGRHRNGIQFLTLYAGATAPMTANMGGCIVGLHRDNHKRFRRRKPKYTLSFLLHSPHYTGWTQIATHNAIFAINVHDPSAQRRNCYQLQKQNSQPSFSIWYHIHLNMFILVEIVSLINIGILFR